MIVKVKCIKLWLHEINLNEIQKGLRRVKQDPDIKGDKGTEPAKYYARYCQEKCQKQKRDDTLKEVQRWTMMTQQYKPATGDR